MRKILVPIDLTESSDNAVNLTKRLVDKKNTEIVVLNIVNAPSDAVLHENGIVKEDQEIDLTAYMLEAQQNLKIIKSRYTGQENIVFRTEVGDINNIILGELSSGLYDLLVLGMAGQLTASFWSNTHTEYLSKYSKVPVLTLKCDRSNMPLDKIVFVSDFLTDDLIDLTILKNIAKKYNSQIILLKVVTDDQQRSDDEIKTMASSFAENNGLTNVEAYIHKAESVEEGIVTFCNANNIDLIAIGTHQRGGFSTLFRRSISQNIVRDLYHPIITIPIKQA